VTIGGRPPDRRWSGEAIAVGLFAAIQTFILFARRDRFSVLFWWTSESWPYVSVLWVKDLALGAAAFFLFAELARTTIALPEPTVESGRGGRVRHALLFTVILAAGVTLRWIAPRLIPPGVWADALFEAEGVLRTPGHIPWLGGRPLDIEGLRNSALVSNLYLKSCALLFRIFGRGDTGILSLSAVGGSFALPAIYWLGREMGSRRRALVAMGILAFAAWPLISSRWAWIGSLLVPLVVCAAAAALRALRTRSLPWALASGVLVGLSLHTHPAAWAAAAGLGAFGLTVLRPSRAGRLFAAAALGGVLAFLPFGLAFLKYPERIGGRAQDVSFLAPTKDVAIPGGNGPYAPPLRLLYNTVHYTGLFLWTRDPNPRHGIPDRPPLDPLLGVAALAGAAVAVRKSRAGEAGERLVLFLAAASLLSGILGNPGGAPNVSRIAPYVAAPALWAAGAFDRWIPAAASLLSVRRGIAWALALVVFFLLETEVFLTTWPDHHLVVSSFCVTETETGRTARALGPAPIVVEPKALSWPIVFETLAAGEDPNRPVPRLPRRTAADLVRAAPDGPLWFVARDEDLEILRRASWRCPPRRSGEAAAATTVFRVAPPRG
jgi:hypothetical protein